MSNIASLNLDYDRPIRLAEDVHWVGTFDGQSGSYSNTYLIVDRDEAVLIDGGSRADFPTVMMKIMQTGITPSAVMALVYQNYNPRFCGSIPHMEVIIDRPSLRIISDQANHMFIQHYSDSGHLLSLEDVGHRLRFSSGRVLEFIKTPFAHSAGSFVTFDWKSGILFTGDLFSSYASKWSLLLKLRAACKTCRDYSNCPDDKDYCPVQDILRFHRDIMSSERALKYALERIATVPFTAIAPQHGGVIHDVEDIVVISELLASLKGVGIDRIIGERSFFELGDTSPIKIRLLKKSTP